MLSLRALAHVTRNAHMPSPERCWIRTTQSGGAQDDETVTVGMKVVGVIYRSNPEVSASSSVACGEYAHLVQRVQETIFRSVALAGFVPLTSRPYERERMRTRPIVWPATAAPYISSHRIELDGHLVEVSASGGATTRPSCAPRAA